ncbi:hypothetical protein J437_LFUL006390 [Ladona fulva]|uniref:DDE-1 domain-containing protein n=1 Tax=Ladona fulva TaxID=123851 RepID=A0A8K0NYD6_LADFU|nr:hypothetical protein J437_LFUL006390 [Ladona fulva]
MANAVSDGIHKKSSVNAAVKKNNVPEPTLRRYLKKSCTNDTEGEVGKKISWVLQKTLEDLKKTFSEEQTSELKCAEALVLLLMDNHATHTTLEAVDFCRAHNIFLLGFPPHTSHKQQPLDVIFYSPFKAGYRQGCDDFMVNYPGSAIAIKDLAGILERPS